jgi:hypothetical protein
VHRRPKPTDHEEGMKEEEEGEEEEGKGEEEEEEHRDRCRSSIRFTEEW